MSSQPIRIFIGTDETQTVPTAVLRHSVLSRTPAEVDIRELQDLRTGLKDRFYTGFSFYRWAIPSQCEYAGRAIYLDADIVVLSDIRELWELSMEGHSHLCRPRPGFRFRRFRFQRLGGAYASVMLIDCSRCRHWDFTAWCERVSNDPLFYKQAMWCLPGGPTTMGRGNLPPEFNDLDHFEAGRTKIIHYTKLLKQPWKKTGHPHERVFRQALHNAYKAGAVNLAAVEASVARGHIHSHMVDWCTQDFPAV